MKTVVTGGRGFIGSNLVRRLLQDSADVVIFDSRATSAAAESALPDGVREIHGDVRDSNALERAFTGATHVVHLAALSSVQLSLQNPSLTHEVNATGTLNVLDAARRSGVDYVLLASSSAVFGSNPKPAKGPGDWVSPLSPYGASKLALEGYASAYRSSFGLQTQSLRLFNVYGPGQTADHPYAAVIPQFIERALANLPLVIEGDGHQSRDFTFVDTVCEVIARALANRTSVDRPISVGHGEPHTVDDVASTLEQVIGHGLARTYAPARDSDVRHSAADPSDLDALFPDLDAVSLHDGLAATVAWHRSRRG